jgi:hypothetical protein
MTWYMAWLSISAMTGFTLPGMIDEPGWTAGSWISASPVAGPGAEQADIVGDARQVLRQRAQRAAEVDQVGHALHRLEQVVRFEQLDAGQTAQRVHHPRVVLRVSVQPLPVAVPPMPSRRNPSAAATIFSRSRSTARA